MFCPFCGSQLNDGSDFCHNCGSRLDNIPKPEAAPVNTAAAQDAPAETPFPGTDPGAPAGNPGAPAFDNFQGMTPPPFPGANGANDGVPGGMPGQFGVPGNGYNEMPQGFGTYQPEAVRPKKRSKLPLIIVLSALGVIIAGGVLAFIITLNNGYLYRSGGLQKIYDLTHLCLQHHYADADCENPEKCEICGDERGEALGHDWIEATCTTPRTCADCGKTEGQPAPHTWVEATCTTPRTCSTCGATEGTALGHTTGFGTCARCGQKSTELQSEFYSIMSLANDGDSYFNIGYEYMVDASNTVSSYYYAAMDAEYYFSMAKQRYSDAADACSGYDEFADLRRYLTTAANAMPDYYPEYSVDSINTFIDYVVEAWYAKQDLAEYAATLYAICN